MKANLPLLRKRHLFSLLGILSVMMLVSCGSYQNTSYYDNDGIYGSNQRYEVSNDNKYSQQNLESSNKYSQQFKSMQDDYTYFTDVEDYSSENNDSVVTVYKNYDTNSQYAGWGNNSSSVTVNYYDNSWGWNNWYSPYWGIGWNNWYGSSWGWGRPYFGTSWGWGTYGPGWGWSSWYGPAYYGGYPYGGYYNYYGPGWYNNGYYGGGRRHLAYNSGTRGGSSYYVANGNRYSNRTTSTRNFNNTRTSVNRNTYSNTRNTSGTRNTYSSPRTSGTRNNYSTPRNNSSTSNTNFSTPRSSSSTRSSSNYTPSRSSGGSYGGGRSSSGGGRSTGGRGGRG
ncbi:MAG: hypothetical protein CMP76_06135 [Flavobacterium sp.]|uniref:hypothetical protein n=1 Tax=Flavobacterium sp. TaxID=239 RepID=UPI000C49D4AF|nr:hypothetical protein [Flavobacterium sp.]MBF02857.1 hypothetical protein [Flavobacterium sp.]